MSFSTAVWLFPVVVLIQMLEEWPKFSGWARQHASPRYTHQEYVRIHVAAVVLSVVTAAILFVKQFPA